VAIHRSNPKKKGPAVSVPGTKKAAPPTGRSSFAKRVKTRRRKADAAAASRPKASSSVATGKASQPALLTREERLAVARSKNPARAGDPPTPAAPPSFQPTAPVAPTPAQEPRTHKPQPTRPTNQREPDPGFVAVGRVLAAFGLKGELKIQSLTDNPERFASKSRLYAGQQLVTVAAVREAGQHTYITLKGFPDRSSAEKFRGALLQVPESELPELEEGEFYRFQLVGLEVFDTAGAKLGEVAEVIDTGATDVYRVTAPEVPDLLLAAAPDVIIEIDLKKERMIVDPPAWT
jgi:16S rRNA processing protein RimM